MGDQTARTGPGVSRVATTTSAVVATAFPAATEAAVEALRSGGNAVDAAVTAAWALAVCEPSGSGLGGQTTLLIHTPDGRSVVVDGHSYAPAAVSRREVSRAAQGQGFRACTIPSTPATLGAALERYGRFSLERTLEPAIRLGEDGFPVTRLLRRHVRLCRDSLVACPHASRRFLRSGRLPRVGRILRQRKLARTLRGLAARGVGDFYSGEIAAAIAEDMRANGGLLTAADLERCHLPVERQPLSIAHQGYRILSAPPPGGGLQLLQALKVFAALAPSGGLEDPAAWYEAIAIAIDAVFRERERWPVHPRDSSRSLFDWQLGDLRAAELASAAHVPRESRDAEPEEPGETTHLCVGDSDGMVVSLTQSIQSLFGAKVANRKLGFFYNNYLVTCPRRQHPYQLRGGAMPRSNASPTVVLDERGRCPRPVLVLGAAGSRRITSALLQVLARRLDGHAPLADAVDAARVHPRPSGNVLLERCPETELVAARLQRRFSRVVWRAGHSFSMGAVQAIGKTSEDGWVGVADPRREGSADGC